MKLEIKVRRFRRSVTQGEAGVYINGQFVISYGDEIQMITGNAQAFGEVIDGWASTKPDMAFIRELLASDYPIRDRLNAVLTSIEAEERGDDPVERVLRKQHEYFAVFGGVLNISEADEIYNDFNRELIEAMKRKFGKVFLGKINIYDATTRRDLLSGLRSACHEYQGELIRNNDCDFAVPVEDAKLDQMIRDWNDSERSGKLGRDAKSITDRIEELGGVIFIWY